jgi:hypothetical protein
MKYLKIFEMFKNRNEHGDDSDVFYIDDDWILKMPNNKLAGKKRIEKFDKHINFMKQYPDIFPEIKRLDKYRASIERLDTYSAIQEINYLSDIIVPSIGILPNESRSTVIQQLYELDYAELDKLNKFGLEENNIVAKNWYLFIKKLKDRLNNLKIDINSSNFGIDKYGNIKLIDF